MDKETRIVPLERINTAIYVVREHKVMLDRDLAVLYGVQTRALVQAVKRNANRFPADFMFQLTSQEVATLRSQSVIFGSRPGTSKYRPYAFTEAGIGMLSSVLRSPRAVAVNIEIVRTFVMLREHGLANHELQRRIDALEEKFDSGFKKVFDAIREATKPELLKPTLGFARKKIG